MVVARRRYNPQLMSDLFIDTRGHGDRHVVLLHGWAMHGGVFAPLVEQLEATCTLHLVDLPGHGRSRDCALPLEPATCARVIAAATPPALWLGWSLGGAIALRAALDFPEQVGALAMVCASPCFVRRADWEYGVSPEVFTDFGRELDCDHHATVERFLALEAMGSDHAREDMRRMRGEVFRYGDPDPRVLHEGLALLQEFDLRASLSALTQPSAWIAGSRDRLVPWRALAWSANACGGRSIRIEHAGHAPFIGFSADVAGAVMSLLQVAPA